jgi:HupE / UreJ protein
LTSKTPLRFDCEWGRAAGAPRLDQARMAAAFVRHGIMHILTGYDHLLFVGALVLAVVNLWDLVKVIGAFTLAHTITLTLAALDVFRLPGSIVEPMIAASIVFVAAQNLFWPKQSRGGSRLLVAFLFGLFHGLGFASGLLEAMSGLRAAGAAVAIAAFSLAWVSEGWAYAKQILMFPQGLSEVGRERRVPTLRESMAGSLGLV